MEVSIRDLTTGAGARLGVAPSSAIDAFFHPYAYLARRNNRDGAVQAKTTSSDG